MGLLSLPSELVALLPDGAAEGDVAVHVQLFVGLEGTFGETHLLLCKGRLVVVHRASLLEPFQRADLGPGRPTLERGDIDSTLRVPLAGGRTCDLRVSILARDEVARLVDGIVDGPVDRSSGGPAASSSAVAVRGEDAPTTPETAEERERRLLPPLPPLDDPLADQWKEPVPTPEEIDRAAATLEAQARPEEERDDAVEAPPPPPVELVGDQGFARVDRIARERETAPEPSFEGAEMSRGDGRGGRKGRRKRGDSVEPRPMEERIGEGGEYPGLSLVTRPATEEPGPRRRPRPIVRQARRFTLVELMILIAILGVTLAIAWPQIQRWLE